ncbi:MAG: hypothetical protein WDN23_20735 [Edaphobacter sp.]
MKNSIKTSVIVASALAIVVIIGCGGGSGTPAPPQVPSTQITTQANINGVLSPWAGAQLYGGAASGTYNCGGPTVDANCQVNFGPVFADSNGSYILSTDALGNVSWTFAASDA